MYTIKRHVLHVVITASSRTPHRDSLPWKLTDLALPKHTMFLAELN